MRIQVNVSEAMLKKIDKYADLMGVTRSSFCAQLIGQGVLNLEKTYEFIDKFNRSDYENNLGYSLLAKHMEKQFNDFEKKLADKKEKNEDRND